MRSIPGLALGTYYAVGAAGGAATPNAGPMRGLVYAVKDNRDPPNPAQPIAHPRHPGTPPGVMIDRNNAISYVAEIVGNRIDVIRRFFGIGSEVVLVPIPSSAVVASTIKTARWPAHKLAFALQKVGLGACSIFAVNRSPVNGKTATGVQRSSEEMLENLEDISEIPRGQAILLVDDTVTTGASIVAIDALLGRPEQLGVFTVGLTDSLPTLDALRIRRFSVDFDPSSQPIMPVISRG